MGSITGRTREDKEALLPRCKALEVGGNRILAHLAVQDQNGQAAPNPLVHLGLPL